MSKAFNEKLWIAPGTRVINRRTGEQAYFTHKWVSAVYWEKEQPSGMHVRGTYKANGHDVLDSIESPLDKVINAGEELSRLVDKWAPDAGYLNSNELLEIEAAQKNWKQKVGALLREIGDWDSRESFNNNPDPVI